MASPGRDRRAHRGGYFAPPPAGIRGRSGESCVRRECGWVGFSRGSRRCRWWRPVPCRRFAPPKRRPDSAATLEAPAQGGAQVVVLPLQPLQPGDLVRPPQLGLGLLRQRHEVVRVALPEGLGLVGTELVLPAGGARKSWPRSSTAAPGVQKRLALSARCPRTDPGGCRGRSNAPPPCLPRRACPRCSGARPGRLCGASLRPCCEPAAPGCARRVVMGHWMRRDAPWLT
jgi:hypothetical protein